MGLPKRGEVWLADPELDGDAKWERIIHDPRPRPALEQLLDEVEAEREKHPEPGAWT